MVKYNRSMTYLTIKIIKGNPYLYEVRSERDGDRVRQVFVRYLGRADRPRAIERRPVMPEAVSVVPEISAVEPEIITPEVVPEVTPTEGIIAPFGDEVGDILAVLKDEKPVSIVKPANLNIIDPEFAREKNMQVRTINFGGEKTAIVFRKGNEVFADKIEELSKRIVDTPEFHKELGEALGYSEADISLFIERMSKEVTPEVTPTPPKGVAPEPPDEY